jgi:hypothetical protein
MIAVFECPFLWDFRIAECLKLAELARTCPDPGEPEQWVVRPRERQISGRNRYYRELLFAVSLTGRPRPFSDL